MEKNIKQISQETKVEFKQTNTDSQSQKEIPLDDKNESSDTQINGLFQFSKAQQITNQEDEEDYEASFDPSEEDQERRRNWEEEEEEEKRQEWLRDQLEERESYQLAMYEADQYDQYLEEIEREKEEGFMREQDEEEMQRLEEEEYEEEFGPFVHDERPNYPCFICDSPFHWSLDCNKR